MAIGCRVSELINIELDNLFLEDLKVKITKAKGGKERWGYFAEECIPFLEEYIALRSELPQSDSPYLFVSHVFKQDTGWQLTRQGVNYIVGKHTENAGQKLSSHKLRHWYATTLLNNGVDINTVKDNLGHENIATTQIYLPTDEELQRKSSGVMSDMFAGLNTESKCRTFIS